jgi:hypothetical protein
VDERRIRYCKRINEGLLQTINTQKPKTIQALAEIWYRTLGELHRERRYHSSRYYGLNLHSTFTKGTIEIRLFNGTMHAGVLRAYCVFCLALCHQALTQKSARAGRTATTNEKYTFRCWLLRLGLIGDEFKHCRNHLMKHLTGDAAFRTPRRSVA